MREELGRTIESKEEELVALTRDLIAFPTINPPGEAIVLVRSSLASG